MALASSEEASPKPEPIDHSATFKEEIKNLKAALVLAKREHENLAAEKFSLEKAHKDEILKLRLSGNNNFVV